MTLRLFFLFLIINGTVTAQTARIDSLRKVFQQTKKDSHKVVLCTELLRSFHLRSTDSSTLYVNKGIHLAKKINSPISEARFIYIQALVYEQTSSREKTIQQYLKALPLFEVIPDTVNIIKVHSALISRYNEIGNLQQSLAHYHTAKRYLKPKNLEGRTSLNNRIGLVYTESDMATAMRYFQLNLPLYRELADYHGLGFTYENIGSAFMDLGYRDSAIYYLKKGVEYQRLTNKPQALASNLSALVSFYINQGYYEQALNYNLEAVGILESVNSDFYLVLEYAKLAKIYLQLKDYTKALRYGEKALQLSRETQDLVSRKNLLETLANSHVATNNYKKAFFYERQRLTVNDSLSNTANKKVVEELEQQYQNKEKQAQIDLQNTQLSRQQTLLITSIIIAGLLFFLAFLAFRIAQQRKKTNAQLRQLDEAKSHFFANISHELRTPLTLIIAPLENALQQSKNNVLNVNLELAHSNGKKLLNLVNEILDLSKLESGKLKLYKKEAHLLTLLRRLFFAFESMANIRGIHLHFDFQLPEDLWIKLDIEKFEKIINNLISNAIKFSETDDSVTLTVLPKGDKQFFIKVQDTGNGIPSEDLPKIFNRFYQSEQPNQKLQGGTGIGLALAKELSHLFQGELTVSSQVNKGTTFQLLLPLEKTNSKSIEPAIHFDLSEQLATHNYKPQVLHSGKPRILIVEDNPDMSQFLFKTLSIHYQCTTAMNGIEGLEKLQKERFDLITIDVMMPKMDGFTFLKKVHKRELFSHTPVIMLTARSLEADKLQGLQLGVDDYITKPFSTKELIARIDNLLTNKAERDNWHQQKSNLSEEKEESLSLEKELLKKAEALVFENISNSNFKVGNLAKAMNYSQRQLERIIKKLTGLSPGNFIKEIRLQKARQLLESRQFATVAEVGYETGFADSAYFSKVIQKRFGKKPSDWMS